MLFCIKNPHIEGGNILLNGEIIDKVNYFKFFGVIIDSHLSWMDYVQHIRQKILKGIGILYKTKDYLNSDTLLILYNSFVYRYLMYWIEVRGATTKGNLISLLKLKCVLFVWLSLFLSELNQLHCSLNWKCYQCLRFICWNSMTWCLNTTMDKSQKPSTTCSQK